MECVSRNTKQKRYLDKQLVNSCGILVFNTNSNCNSFSSHPSSYSHEKSPQDPAKWIVMGSGRSFFKSSFRNLASLHPSFIFCLIVIFLLVNTATCRSGGDCRVDDCITSYKRADRRMKAAEARSTTELDLTRRRCRVLRKLRRCLQKMQRACRGNLLFHSMKHMNGRDLSSANCSTPHIPHIEIPFPVKPDPETPTANTTSSPTTAFPGKATEGSACTFTGNPNYKHCGLFGDPHLRTFSDEFFTCKIEKTWPLIDNDYMVVMVTNVPVKEGSSATVTTKITVLIRPAGECAGQQHYIATSDQLPGGFTDGSSATGSVSVVEVNPGRLVEIRARFIATTIIIRLVGRYLTFAMRMPEEFVHGLSSKTQLCVQGCPVRHRISSTKKMENLNPIASDSKPTTSFLREKDSKAYYDNISSKVPQEDSSSPKVPLSKPFCTDAEARLKCRQVMLAITGATKKSQVDTNDKPVDNKETTKRLSTSQSSEAFSSLIPSPRRKSKKGRRKNRMAAAYRPEAEMSQSSFNQLSGSEERETDAILPGESRTTSQKNRSKHRKKSKRHTEVHDNPASSKTSHKSSACVTKTNKNNSSFNFYLESCVFDYRMTGDVNFTLAALAALEDVRRTHVLREEAPGASMEVIRQWQPETIEDESDCPTVPPGQSDNKLFGGGGATRATCLTSVLTLSLIFSCLYLNLVSCFFLSSNNTVAFTRQRTQHIDITPFRHSNRTVLLNKVEPVR